MPDVERIGRHQKAVLWAFSSHDRHGAVKVSAGVELDVRWEVVDRSTIRDDGTPLNVDAVVWTDRNVVALGIIWLGRLADVPSPVTDVMQVITTEKIPDIRGRVIQYSVLLRRYGDALPEVI